MNIRFESALENDFDLLVELRIEAMRESLEAIGRFNRARSVERFRYSFDLANTKKIYLESGFVGFYAMTQNEDYLYLDHLYIDPGHQSLGIGSAVMELLIGISVRKNLPIRLGALKGSRSNEFYGRFGFVVTSEDEWDVYYERIVGVWKR